MTSHTCFDLIILHIKSIFNFFRIDYNDKEPSHKDIKKSLISLLKNLRNPNNECSASGRLEVKKNYDENGDIESVNFYYEIGTIDWKDVKELIEFYTP